MDVWISVDEGSVGRMITVMADFGFDRDAISPSLFLNDEGVVRMGVPPLRLVLLRQISGVQFDQCFAKRVEGEIDGLLVNIISLEDLRANKQAAGRFKDLNDLEHLTGP